MTVIHKKRTVDDVDKAADVGVKYHCDFCQVNITSTVRIKCANCTDFDLCVKCFTHGVEIGKHKNDHDYQVVDKHTFPIFDSSWGADEELLLIEALEIYGMGNWADAADHVGTKNKEECEQHYIDTYVNSETWPLPNMNLDFSPEIDAVSDRKKVKVTKQALNRYGKPLQSMPSNHEIAGYMPGRYEFETEYDNEAEQYVKDLVFGEEDTPEETELKLTVFEIYNSKLDKRTERKKFIFQRGLLDYRKNLANERKRTKEERDLINKTKVFARLQTADDYEKFLAGLINEMALRKRIAELQEYRRNGITTLAEAEVYERDKAQRQSNLKLLTGRESLAASERLSRYASRHVPQETSPVPKSANQKMIGRKPANPLDIQEADGVHLLTPAEQTICSALRILPKAYMVIKETILKEYARLGSLKRRQARELIKIDVNKTSKIYDFFIEMGWIKPPARGAASTSTNGTPA